MGCDRRSSGRKREYLSLPSPTRKNQFNIIVFIIVVSLFTESPLIQDSIAYSLVVLGYLFLIIVTPRDNLFLRIPSLTLYLLLPIWILYLFHLVLPVITSQPTSIGMLVRPPVFISFALINLFLIPHLVPAERFYVFISGLSALLVLIGLPTIYSDYHIFMFQITHDYVMNVFGYEVRRITSIFGNPNPAGFFFMIGFVSAFVIYIEKRCEMMLFFTGINLLGLFLTESRAGYLGAVAGVSLFLLMYVSNYKLARIAVSIFSLLAAFGIALFADIIPRPEFISPTDFGNRPGLWEGGVQAITNSPTGYGTRRASDIIEPYLIPQLAGQGIHSAYLRLFLSTGIIGGITYAIFTVHSLFSSAQKNATVGDLIVFAVAVAIATKEIFEGNTIFGLSVSSLLIAITFGYAISSRSSI